MSDISRLEAALFQAWPPRQIDEIGSWRLHFGDGYTSRRNSVQPIGDPGLPLPDAIAAAEAWYQTMRLPPIFRVTPRSPTGLDAQLAERGYERRSETLVVVGPAAGVAGPDIATEDRPSADWLSGRMAIGRVAPDQHDVVALPYLDAGPRTIFASVGEPHLAVGMAVINDGLVGVYSVMVDDSARRRGLGRKLTAHLLEVAAHRGATTAYLQVEATNEPALDLYRDLGFGEAYRYHYRQPAEEDSPPRR